MIDRNIDKLEKLFLGLQRRIDLIEKRQFVSTRKISEMTPAGNSLLTDLSEIARPGSGGAYITYNVTEQNRVDLIKSKLLQGSYSASPTIISGASSITNIQSFYNGGNSEVGSLVISGIQFQITMSATTGIVEVSNAITPNFSGGLQAFGMGSVHKKDEEAQGDGEILDISSNPVNNKITMNISTSTIGIFIVVAMWFYVILPMPFNKKLSKEIQ